MDYLSSQLFKSHPTLLTLLHYRKQFSSCYVFFFFFFIFYFVFKLKIVQSSAAVDFLISFTLSVCRLLSFISINSFIKFFLCYFKRFFFGLVWQPARSSVQRPRLVKLVHRVCVSRSSSSSTDSVLSNRNNIFYFQRRPRPHPVAPSHSVSHPHPR